MTYIKNDMKYKFFLIYEFTWKLLQINYTIYYTSFQRLVVLSFSRLVWHLEQINRG